LVAKPINEPAFALVAQYSGKYRPAWRISHTGVWGVACLKQARKNVSFINDLFMMDVILQIYFDDLFYKEPDNS
jgi:hypothetical protein